MARYAVVRHFTAGQEAGRQHVALCDKTSAHGRRGDGGENGGHSAEIEKNIAVFKKAVDGMAENG